MPMFYLQVTDGEGRPLTSPVAPLKARHGGMAIPLVERCEEEIIARWKALQLPSEPEAPAKLRPWARLLWEPVKTIRTTRAAVIAFDEDTVRQIIREGITSAIHQLKHDAHLALVR